MTHVFPPCVDRIIDLALEEDLGRGDVTTRLVVPASVEASGRVVAKQEVVISGTRVFEAVAHRVDPEIRVRVLIADGLEARPNDAVLVVEGNAASLLSAERTALNFLQRLSGVATLTRAFVRAVPPDRAARIADTRKTTPGMRFLEREAVRHGGGWNHRPDLGGGVLVKENHAALAGSIAKAVRLCREGAPHPLRVQVETRTLDEVREAIEAGADAVLLDNMPIEDISRAVAIAKGRAVVEVSGGVRLESVAAIAATGADVISVGMLTHSAPAADLSFLLDAVRPPR